MTRESKIRTEPVQWKSVRIHDMTYDVLQRYREESGLSLSVLLAMAIKELRNTRSYKAFRRLDEGE